MRDPILQTIFYKWMIPFHRFCVWPYADSFIIFVIIITFSITITWNEIMGYNMLLFIPLYIFVVISVIRALHVCLYGENINIQMDIDRNIDRTYGKSVLLYNGSNVPTVYLREDNSYQNGYSYGMLIRDMAIKINYSTTRLFGKLSETSYLQIINILDNNLIAEFNGLYDAMKTYIPNLTKIELMSLQCVPELGNMSCTCYSMYESKNNNSNVIFGRNVDWPSIGYGYLTIKVDYNKYVNLVIPGMIGCITGWRNKYILAINTVDAKYYDIHENRLPMALYNRTILQNFDLLGDIKSFIERTGGPMQACHLTIASNLESMCFSFYQNNGKTYIRSLSGNQSMETLNWSYPDKNHPRFISNYRHSMIKNIENNNSSNNIQKMIDILTSCQSVITVNSILAHWEDDNLHVEVHAGNNFAADKWRLQN